MKSDEQIINLPIVNKAVTRVFFDGEFGLEFWTSDEMMTLRIGAPFKITNARKDLSPAHPEGLAPTFSLLGKKVNAATAEKNGNLDISFSDNRKIHVDPISKNEAWGLAGPADFKIVCLPGGELTIWK